MTLEHKLKKAAVMAAVDISLKRIGRSPERCARNLIELGITAYPDKLSKNQITDLTITLIMLCRNHDMQKARTLFMQSFLPDATYDIQ